MSFDLAEGYKPVIEVEVIIAGLKSQFSPSDLKKIAFTLLEDLYPPFSPEESASISYPRPVPPSGLEGLEQ